MRLSTPLTLAGAVALAACAQAPIQPVAAETAAATASTPTAVTNPFFAPSTLPYLLPPFDKITDADYAPAFEQGMAAQKAEIAAITANPEPATVANTLVAMERSGQLLNRVSAVFFYLAGTDTNPSIQQLQAELAPKLSAHRDSISLDAALFARIKQLYEQRATLGLDAETLRLVERTHTDFVRAGANLAEADKARLRAINEQLSSLTTAFQQNNLKETNAGAVVVDTLAELDGLSADAIAAAAEAAKARKLDGKYVLALMNTSGQPPLASLRNRALRERLYKASLARGTQGGEFDNRAGIASIVKLRAEKARLLGYATHADYVLEDETAGSSKAVNQRLAQLAPAAVANAKKEAKALQKLIDQERGGFKLAAWDWAYYSEKQRKAQYDFDESQMKPYLELDRVLVDGVFYAANRLYGLTFQRRSDLPTYGPDVRVYEVFNADGTPLALFMADFYARSSKRGGAWMSSFVDQSKLMGTRPVVTNNLNIPKPPAGQPTLMTWDEVTTMFHEFGHALHGMLSDVQYPSFSGTSVPRDFVEYPSQVNEMWADDPQVLAHYAKHWQTGEAMPQALVDKVKASSKFNQGFATTEYLGAALLDQSWHQLAPEQAPGAEGVLAFEAAALKQAGVDFAAVPPRYRSGYFSHIFAGGYSAGYYAYIWSEVLDADTVEWFKERGGL
ncbi:MAG: M3 family metallopeptidase, partial [Stagnimonas sp.]|nr:M3 family metallopeptidase [Stagnimonas sp.]